MPKENEIELVDFVHKNTALLQQAQPHVQDLIEELEEGFIRQLQKSPRLGEVLVDMGKGNPRSVDQVLRVQCRNQVATEWSETPRFRMDTSYKPRDWFQK